MRLQRFLRYGYEGFAIYFALVPFYMRTNQLPPLTAFLIVYLFSLVVFFLFLKNKKSVSYFLLALAGSILIALALILGFSVLLAAGLGIVCCWRAFTLFFRLRDLSNTLDEVALFFYTLGFAMFLFIFFASYEYHSSILVIVVLQFVYLLGMKMAARLSESGFVGDEQRQAYMRWGSGALFGLMGLSALLLFIYPAVKWVLFTGLGLLARAIGFVIVYPIFWLLSLLTDPQAAGEAMEGILHLNDRPKKEPPDYEGFAFPMDWVFWGLLACALIIALIVFFRKKIKVNEARDLGQSNSQPLNVIRRTFAGKKRRIKPPKDPVRRRFYQLQRALATRGMERSASESVADWLDRLDLDRSEKENVAAEYRRVRYGNETLSLDEQNRYEQSVKALIQQAKEKKKK